MVGASEPLFGGDARLHVKLFPLLVPLLELLVVLPQEVRPDLVIQHTHHPSFPVLTGQLDVHFALASLGIVGDTRWCDLVLLKID